MDKYKTLVKNTGLILLGTVGSKLVNLIMLPIYTHWLKPEEFGAVDSITTYSMFIIGFVCLCLPDAIFIFPYNANTQKKKEYFSSGLAFSFVAIACSSLLFWGVQQWMLSNDIHNVFSDYVWLIFWMMVTSYIQNYTQSFTRSLNKMAHYSIAGIVLTFAIAGLSILLIPRYGLLGYVWALILAQLVAALYSFIAAGVYKYVQLAGCSWISVKEMLSYSAPLLPNGIMWWLVNGINRPVMEHLLGLVAIGLYAVANKFTGMLYSILNILSTAWGNSVLDEYGKPGFDRFYNNYMRMLGAILFLGGYALIIFSRSIVGLFAASEYFTAYYYIPPLMGGVIFSGLSGAVGGVFSATKTSKYFFYSSIWGGASSVVSLLVLTPLFDLMGTCLSVAISFFCMFIARVYYASKYVKIDNISYYIKLLIIFIFVSLLELHVNGVVKYIGYFIFISMAIYFCYNDVLLILNKLGVKSRIYKK